MDVVVSAAGQHVSSDHLDGAAAQPHFHSLFRLTHWLPRTLSNPIGAASESLALIPAAMPTHEQSCAFTEQAGQLSELISYYTYDSEMNTDSFNMSNETFAVAAELRSQVEDVGAALAKTQVCCCTPSLLN